jgi:N-acetylmuramoyl-L-alanine amidase
MDVFSREIYFSARDIALDYGCSVVFHPVTGKIVLSTNSRKLEIYIKSTRVFIDGKKKNLTWPTRLVGNDVFVPASFFTSGDFAGFTQTISQFNSSSMILNAEKNTNVGLPRFYSKPDSTQIVIELTEALQYNWKQNEKGDISISFPRGRVPADKMSVDNGIVKAIESKNTGGQAQINILLTPESGTVDKKYLSDQKKLIIAVMKKGNDTKVREALAVSSQTVVQAGLSTDTSAQFNVETVSAPVTLVTTKDLTAEAPPVVVPSIAATESKPVKKKILILDAGHGGEDSGAIGPNGTKEKDINLKIVFELKRLFEEDGGYEVFLTRTDDTFIPLVERTSFANEKKADMFIAVHCNANMDRNVAGFEIYFLSENASDSDAAATAVLENSVVRLEGKPNRKRAKLQELLWSMTVNEFINESSELCSIVGGEVSHRIKIENRGVKQAGFFVLRGAMMPAVLVECAFLSNYGEEAKLKTRKFQSSMADSIYEGVKRYEQRQENLHARRN